MRCFVVLLGISSIIQAFCSEQHSTCPTIENSDLSVRLTSFEEILRKMKRLKAEKMTQLGWLLLHNNALDAAIKVLDQIQDSSDFLASSMLGVALHLRQNSANEPERAEELLKKGQGITIVSNMFGYLAGALKRLNLTESVELVYEIGVKHGHFVSHFQRAVFNPSRPVWTKSETTYETQLSLIEKHWRSIRDEALEALFGKKISFHDEAENLKEEGLWQQMVLYENGQRMQDACNLAPLTCSLFKDFPEGSTEMFRGQVKFSIIHPGTHIRPHSGPTNCRLRGHLGLVVPRPDENGNPVVWMRIGNHLKNLIWSEGKFFIIDDSFEHEVWHVGDQSSGIRLVLLVDMWHPEMTLEEKLQIKENVVHVDKDRSTIFNVAGVVENVN